MAIAYKSGLTDSTVTQAVYTISTAKALTSFGFVSPAVTGTTDESTHTVAVTVPYGTAVTSLVAVFTSSGSQVKVGSTVQVSGVTANNFTNPVTYTVVAGDGSTQDYVVTVTVSSSSAKALTSFGFVSPAVTGTVDESTHMVAVTVPYGTAVTSLVAVFTSSGSQVKVGSAIQVSGSTANNFTNPVTYTVVAGDWSTQDYVVTVSQTPVSPGAWDISAATYSGKSVSMQSGYPYGITFKPDGTGMYESGRSASAIYQYSLSTAWDSSTAIYDGKYVASQSAYPMAVQFRPDGLRMYELQYGGPGTVYQYTLATAWDVSTASYVGVSFGASGETGNEAVGLYFKPDGTRMYISSGTTHRIYQYFLSTAWDVSTANYDSVSIPSQNLWPNGVYLSPDGTRLYECGNDPNDYLYQYALSTAWDLSTAAYEGVYLDVASEGHPNHLFFKPDGTRVYVLNIDAYGHGKVYEYYL